jgi:mRNA interferase YafQ
MNACHWLVAWLACALGGLIDTVRPGHPLEARHREHALTGDRKVWRDCHIYSDWAMIYSVDDLAVYLTRKGAHSDLF